MNERKSAWGIAVGTDGSVSALAAVRWAAREAKMRCVPLTVIHAVDGPITDISEKAADGIIAAAIAAARGSDAASDAASDALDIESVRAQGKSVWAALADSCSDDQMLVVGCRGGRTGRHRRSIGSVGVGLLHHAHCPVAIVHDDDALGEPLVRRPVLVGIDGSRASLVATAIAFDEASRRGVDLLAMHVCKGPDTSGTKGPHSSVLESEAEELLIQSLAESQHRYPKVVVHRLVRFESPARHLLDQAERAQLVVVGSHGRGGFAGKLLGSVSAAVAEEAHIPVIVARPD